jgi:hypothetical protein
MKTPILIRGIPGRSKVIFEIWGHDDGRTIKLSHPEVKEGRKGVMYMEYTDELEPGETKVTEDKYHAFESSVTRTVRDANGKIIEENTWHSRYRFHDGTTLVGRYPDDPPEGTRVLATEYVPHPPRN